MVCKIWKSAHITFFHISVHANSIILSIFKNLFWKIWFRLTRLPRCTLDIGLWTLPVSVTKHSMCGHVWCQILLFPCRCYQFFKSRSHWFIAVSTFYTTAIRVGESVNQIWFRKLQLDWEQRIWSRWNFDRNYWLLKLVLNLLYHLEETTINVFVLPTQYAGTW